MKTEDNAKFNGLQIGGIDGKLKSKLYLGLKKKEKYLLRTKTPEKKIDVKFAES